MAKEKTTTALPAPAAAAKTLAIRLTHSPLYKQAIAWRDAAVTIVIGSKESHEGALRQAKDGKTLRKGAIEFYKPMKQEIDRVKKVVLDLEREELGIIDAGGDKLEARIVAWVTADNARIEAAEAVTRAKALAAETARREREIKEQLDRAEQLEADSPNLSAGELWFVTKMAEQLIDYTSTATVDQTAMGVIVKQAGYADPRKTLDRFLKSEKIRAAIDAQNEILAIRDQAAALREQPIAVTAIKVESKQGKVAGMRMTKNYSCSGVHDLAALRKAYKAGLLPDEAFEPNMVHLRAMAKDLAIKFEQVYPGATLKITEGVAG